MSKNKNIIVFFLIVICTFIYADQSDDVRFKFRGSLSFVASTIFKHHDGIMPENRFSPIDYTTLDYREGESGRIIGGSSSLPLCELYFDYDFIIHLFKTDNLIFKGNHIRFTLSSNLSVVTFNTGASVTVALFPFLEFQGGFLLGLGWGLPIASGFGINDHGTIKRLDFAAPYFQGWFSVTFQMDFGYVVPEYLKRWLHIFFVLTPQLKYLTLATVPDNQPYMYQECPGEKMNGWNLLGKFIFGYRYFFVEDQDAENGIFIDRKNKNFILAIGMYLWIEYFNLSHYYDSPMEKGWGSDFAYISFGPVARVDFPYNFYIQGFFLFGNEKAYTESSVKEKFYQDRVYKDWYVYARWIGAFIGYRF